MVQVTLLGWAVLAGLALGVGLWMLVTLVPRLGRPRLSARVAPYVYDISPGARELVDRPTVNPLPVFGMLLQPVSSRAITLLSRVLGGTDATARTLRQAGVVLTVDAFRARQLAWGAAGAAAGVLTSIAATRLQGIPAIASLAIVIVFAASGVVLRDWLLQRAARARLSRMASELPTVLEFLTLSLSAGEGILDAIRRVSRISRGELSVELATVIADVNTGLPFAESLVALADTLRLPAFTRCVEQVTGALDRGTPLVEVLRAQAQDSRDEAKRGLLELAGRKEVAMLVPLVFLILPTTIAFAIFPGIMVLQLGF